MTPERKAGLILLCVVVIGFIVIAIEVKNENAAAYANAKSLNETPYLITEYGNGVYVIAPRQYNCNVGGNTDAMALGLVEVKSKCKITSIDTWMNQNGAYAILATTSDVCGITAVPYQGLH